MKGKNSGLTGKIYVSSKRHDLGGAVFTFVGGGLTQRVKLGKPNNAPFDELTRRNRIYGLFLYNTNFIYNIFIKTIKNMVEEHYSITRYCSTTLYLLTVSRQTHIQFNPP